METDLCVFDIVRENSLTIHAKTTDGIDTNEMSRTKATATQAKRPRMRCNYTTVG